MPAPGAAHSSVQKISHNPFLSHGFLAALETSKSVGARAGWQVQHLLVHAADGTLVAAAPCYLKSHSRGEYVFDQGWAEAYAHAGGNYYPKLQVAVPFTPATGRRLLVRPGRHAAMRAKLWWAGSSSFVASTARPAYTSRSRPKTNTASSASSASCSAPTSNSTGKTPGTAALTISSAALASRKRKTIRREREEALKNGIDVQWLTGSDLTEEVWDHFFGFYMETGSRKWGRPYLTRPFFSLIGETMRDDVLLVMAKRAGRWIAGAINFIGSETLFGRHWGAVEHHPFLHFELCYYQAIDYAIAQKLARVEAGAQGEHKIARGYMPTTTYSAHYIADPALRRGIADYLKRERAYVAAMGDELAAAGPFRQGFDRQDPATETD